jgi:hypothetical protein
MVRISFDARCSMTLVDCTVQEVYKLALEIFEKIQVTSTVQIVKHSPLQKPQSMMGIVMTVREESVTNKDNGYKGKSKNKTLYGLNAEEALKVFQNHLQKELKLEVEDQQ